MSSSRVVVIFSVSCGRAELQSGHGDLEPVPPLGGRLHPAAQRQKLHRGPDRPVSLPVKHPEYQFPLLAVSQNMQPAEEHTQCLFVSDAFTVGFVSFVDNKNILFTSLQPVTFILCSSCSQ